MEFLRNREVVRTFLFHILISAAASAAALVWDARFGLFTMAFATVLLIFHGVCTYRRYRRIYDLSGDIDRILHGDGVKVSLNKYREGELGVLQSEIHKMTCRLSEQKQQLQNDKVYLADSIADISHQIRTPLTSVNLLVQLLSEPDISDERRIKLTHELLGSLSRIDWLITALLKISRLDAGTVEFKNETVPLEELIRKSVSPLLVPIELKEQTLEVNAAGSFTGDISWTVEAVGNIVKNCMEHTPNGGSIVINANENVLFSEITVSDNGSGIDREDLPHIFERFYKGKNSDDKSFGIGLALARTIIMSQNGTVKAENKTAGGALFSIRFYKGTV